VEILKAECFKSISTGRDAFIFFEHSRHKIEAMAFNNFHQSITFDWLLSEGIFMTASGFRSVPSSFKRVFLVLTLPVLLTACPSADSVFGLSGVATNGHLSGATVTCDADKSTTTTDENGAFSFTRGCRGTITVSGGINIDTGEDFLGELQAPVGAIQTGHDLGFDVATMKGRLLASGLKLGQ
jgi:hypothetical protein